MPFSDIYRNQVELLIRTLPYVADEDYFALKGGTAINLFYRDLPRLSVDIDLTYLPIKDWEDSIEEIDAALKRIAASLRSAEPSYTIHESAPGGQAQINKLNISTPHLVRVKVEVTPVLRGCVYQPVTMQVPPNVEEQFGFAEARVLSFADLYAGKILAALDRQHPRDLFDVGGLLQNEGITDELRTAVVVYLVSHDRRPDKLLMKECRNIAHDYENNFVGMTDQDVRIESLYAAHADLLRDIVSNMPDAHKKFLLSFYQRNPEWELLGVEGIADLPAVKRREQNLDQASEGTAEEIVAELEKVLS